MELSKQAIGRAGEFQAAAIFEQYGVVTSHVDVYSVDLWAETPTGRRVTVQVKTSQAPQTHGRHKTPRYSFQLKNAPSHKADVLCFVALDLGLLRLLSAAEIDGVTTKTYPQAAFTESDMQAEIKRYLY